MKHLKSTLCGIAGLLALCLSVPAAATLGEDVRSVAADQAQLEAALEITGAAKFSLHQLRLPSGTVVREYVSPSGMVFAVTWRGPVPPDLQQVLGRFFDDFAAAVRTQDAGSGARRVQAAGLVAQSGGHMRAFFGRAWLQPMLPRGVLAEEIQ